MVNAIWFQVDLIKIRRKKFCVYGSTHYEMAADNTGKTYSLVPLGIMRPQLKAPLNPRGFRRALNKPPWCRETAVSWTAGRCSVSSWCSHKDVLTMTVTSLIGLYEEALLTLLAYFLLTLPLLFPFHLSLILSFWSFFVFSSHPSHIFSFHFLPVSTIH